MPMTSKSSGLNSAWSKAPIFSQASRQPSSAPSHIMRRKLSGPTGSGNTSPTLARVHTGKRVLSPLPTTHGATDMTDPLIVVTDPPDAGDPPQGCGVRGHPFGRVGAVPLWPTSPPPAVRGAPGGDHATAGEVT